MSLHDKPSSKPLTSFDLDTFIPYRIAVAARRISLDFAKTYRQQFGLTIAEWRVLAHLAHADAVSVREIHQRVDLDKSKVSRAATKLEENGYIEKKVNESDRRLLVLQLTDDGHALMEKLVPLAIDYQRRLMEDLGDEAGQFVKAVEKLIETHDVQNEQA